MRPDAALNRYLQRHTEPETSQLAGLPGRYRHALVVPVYREPLAALQQLLAASTASPACLLIVVANRPDGDHCCDWFDDWQSARTHAPAWASADGRLRLWPNAGGGALLLVDRVQAGPPLPADQGVGLARKIGADIACQLIAEGRVSSPWIANTDADAVLPQDYFDALDAAADAAALVFPYRHVRTERGAWLSTQLYEFGLHHYVEGLRWAGSPYAYHTLGSTLAVHHRHYAAVRGYPRRNAAEDFYLLNKLAKTGAVTSLHRPAILLQARASDRAPFGTGPAVARIEALADPLQYPLYHPAGFAYLRAFLALLGQLAQSAAVSVSADSVARACADQRGDLDPQQLLDYCNGLDWQPILDHCRRQCDTPEARHRHLHSWFDAFRSLKLLNHCRQQVTGAIPFRAWRQQMDNWQQPGSETMHSLYRELLAQTCPDSSAEE